MIRGADFSSYQADAAVQRALGHGLGFAFVKLTEGTGYVNPRATHQLAVLGAHGLRLGVYQYLDPGSALAQWQEFERVLEALPHADQLLVAVDYEAKGVSSPEVRQFITDGREAGYKVGLYHSSSGYPPRLGQAFAWVAKWSTVAPAIGWQFWQFAPGRGGDPDWDLFHGNHAQLAAFWKQHAGRHLPTRYHVTFAATRKKAVVRLGPYKRLRTASRKALAYALRHPSRRSYTIARRRG